jgi:integrase
MPRPSKGARLYKRRARTRNGKIVAQAVWVIRDGEHSIATGCLAAPFETKPPRQAEEALSRYIAEKYQPKRSTRHVEDIDVADVLLVYHSDRGEIGNAHDDLDARISRLNEFWGGKSLAEVNSRSCSTYVNTRGRVGGARRDLEVLRAAINHHAKEGLHRELVRVSLPPKGERRDRWLTRNEAAALLWTCWRYRETQTLHAGAGRGKPVSTSRRPLRHIARFILIGLYTGTRAGAIATASPIAGLGSSFVDLEAGIFYRLATGKAATKKRQPPAPIPPRLLAHMRRWERRRLIGKCFVEFNGKPVASVKKGFASAVRLAALPGKVSPHTLRHTAATWLMQRGVQIWEAAGFLGMSPEVLQNHYGHHHPDFLHGAARAISSKSRVSVAETVVSLNPARSKFGNLQ